jgi:hypothetical protein
VLRVNIAAENDFMGINLSELSTKQQGLIDPRDRVKLKLKTPQERAAKALRGLESIEHRQLLGWLNRNALEVIHAPCSRAVKDLEPGWEDFTLFYRDKYLLIEIKVEGGRLSEDQERMHTRHRAKGMPVFTAGGYRDAKAIISWWLEANFKWSPSE